jgi:hypothetical protein
MMKIKFLLAAVLVAFLATIASAQQVQFDPAITKIVTVSAGRARTAPQASATELTRLKLGTIVSATARSAEQSEVGGKADYWYLVNLPIGQPGWVFGGILKDYDANRRTQIIRQIIEDRLKLDTMSVEDGLDLYKFISSALADAKQPSAQADFELWRLQALGKSFSQMKYDDREKPPYRDWYLAHEKEIAYSEPAAEWMVLSDLYWNMEKKYHGTPAGDRIAWAGTENPIPGECEGDEICNFFYVYQTDGKYISLYPNGAHASEALKAISEALASEELKKSVNSKSVDQYAVEERASLRKALPELRASVARSTKPEGQDVLNRLNEISPTSR